MTDDDDALDRIEREAEDIRLAVARTQRKLWEREKEARERRRAYARAYYAKNRDKLREQQKQLREARRDKDPDRFRALHRESSRRWRDKNKERENAKQRAKYHNDPLPALERRRRYYAEHAEEIKAKRRARYAADKEKQRAIQQAWRDRYKRRRDAGLPYVKLHRVDPHQIQAHEDDATEFFTRRWSSEDVERMRSQGGPPTPENLIAAWERDCLKARAAFRLRRDREMLARLQKEITRQRPGPVPKTVAQLEEERLDAIGRQVNDRLRHHGPPRPPHHNDPAAPHPMLQPHTQTGWNR